MTQLAFSAFGDVVDGITRATWNTSNLSEAAVRQVMVLPLLYAAGLDIWNPLEVQPEETNAAGNRPDLIVRCGNGPERGFVLEIKRRGVALDEGTLGQALSYAGHIGLRWVWLTNGQVWILADEKLAGPYKEREVLKLELGKLHATEDLGGLLERSFWSEGQVEAALERVLKGRLRRVVEKKVADFKTQKGLPTLELAIEWMRDKNLLTEIEENLFTPEPDVMVQVIPKITLSSKVHTFPLEMTFSARGGRGIALVFEDGALEIQAGSTTTAQAVANYQTVWGSWMENLEGKGIVERLDSGQFSFLKPIRYERPSRPGELIAGRSVNGRISWKNAEGQTHKEFFPYVTPNMG